MSAQAEGSGITGDCGEGSDSMTPMKSAGLREISVALVGNPNCGKTTLFNTLSGSHERVGNYSGVTVDAKEATLRAHGYEFNIIDLPGTYSITEYTPEELFVRNYILEKAPDIVINVLDASNLERNLYLTTQLIDMDIKVVAALNMYDELLAKGDTFDYRQLGRLIGIPLIPTIGTTGDGVDDLLKMIISVFEDREDTARHIHIDYGSDIEKSITAIQERIWIEDNCDLTDRVSSRFLAIKLLEKDRPAEEMIFNSCANRTGIFETTAAEIRRMEQLMKADSESVISDAKYAFIAGALKETRKTARRPAVTRSEKIDNVLTHGIVGIPLFILIMWLTFQLTFTLGEYPMGWIDRAISGLSDFVSARMSAGPLKELITEGILAGIGGVIVFLPNILILFFIISFMEDTGYMARAAFIMDRLMHRIGLHGKSFIPMLMGFGCNVPAIMATRTIASPRDRLLTMLIIPFMSCSARLPVYVLFIAAFFPGHAGTMLFLIYALGIVVAALSSLILKKIIFRGEDIPFVMELPPYRMPRTATTARHMWEKGVEYLKKIGGVILTASIIIWALSHYPLKVNYSRDYSAEADRITAEYDIKASTLAAQKEESSPGSISRITQEKNAFLAQLELDRKAEHLEKSYMGRLGETIEPIMRPLGFDWKMSVSIVTGLAAKEIVVGTMGVLYHADTDSDESTQNLADKLKNALHASGPLKGQPVFTPAAALAFIAFVLLYFPCMATIATIRRESGSWRWALFTMFYTTGVAWLVAFIVYRLGGYFTGGL